MTEPTLDVSQASKAVAKFEPRMVQLSTGDPMQVGKLSWLHFSEVWKEVIGVIGAALLGQSPTPDSPTDSAGLLVYVMNELAKLPKAVLVLVSRTTGKQEPELQEYHFADIMLLAYTAIEINVIEMRGALDFANVVRSAITGDTSASGQTTSESTP